MRPRADRLRRFALFLLPLMLLGPEISPHFKSGLAQEQDKSRSEDRKKPTKPELESKSPQQPPPSKQGGFTIGVNVDLVVIHTSVYDKNGHFVGGLKKENFKLFEDGIAQSVGMFSQEDVPVSLGIILDTSGSMRTKIELKVHRNDAFQLG